MCGGMPRNDIELKTTPNPVLKVGEAHCVPPYLAVWALWPSNWWAQIWRIHTWVRFSANLSNNGFHPATTESRPAACKEPPKPPKLTFHAPVLQILSHFKLTRLKTCDQCERHLKVWFSAYFRAYKPGNKQVSAYLELQPETGRSYYCH